MYAAELDLKWVHPRLPPTEVLSASYFVLEGPVRESHGAALRTPDARISVPGICSIPELVVWVCVRLLTSLGLHFFIYKTRGWAQHCDFTKVRMVEEEGNGRFVDVFLMCFQ